MEITVALWSPLCYSVVRADYLASLVLLLCNSTRLASRGNQRGGAVVSGAVLFGTEHAI